MSYTKWAETDTDRPNPENFPWGTVGALIIITVASVLVAGVTFFVYQGKYETKLAELTRERAEARQYLADVKRLRHDQSILENKIKKIETRLSKNEWVNTSASQTSDDPENKDTPDPIDNSELEPETGKRLPALVDNYNFIDFDDSALSFTFYDLQNYDINSNEVFTSNGKFNFYNSDNALLTLVLMKELTKATDLVWDSIDRGDARKYVMARIAFAEQLESIARVQILNYRWHTFNKLPVSRKNSFFDFIGNESIDELMEVDRSSNEFELSLDVMANEVANITIAEFTSLPVPRSQLVSIYKELIASYARFGYGVQLMNKVDLSKSNQGQKMAGPRKIQAELDSTSTAGSPDRVLEVLVDEETSVLKRLKITLAVLIKLSKR